MMEEGPRSTEQGRDARLGCLVLALAVLLPPLLLALTIGCPAAACSATLWLNSAANRNLTGEEDWLVGVVEDGEFLPFLQGGPRGGASRLTRMPMQAAQSPESEEIDLLPYEGRVILVRGHDGGGWIYSGQVIAEGGAILSALFRLLRGHKGSVTDPAR